jgi:hypothetical protein
VSLGGNATGRSGYLEKQNCPTRQMMRSENLALNADGMRRAGFGRGNYRRMSRNELYWSLRMHRDIQMPCRGRGAPWRSSTSRASTTEAVRAVIIKLQTCITARALIHSRARSNSSCFHACATPHTRRHGQSAHRTMPESIAMYLHLLLLSISCSWPESHSPRSDRLDERPRKRRGQPQREPDSQGQDSLKIK